MPVMLTTSKQIMAYPGLRLPKGYLVATTRVYTPEPSSEYYTPPVTSLCYGLCHTNSSFNLSGERRRTSYPMERSLDERHPQDWLLFDHHKRERLPLYPSTYLYGVCTEFRTDLIKISCTT
ncbi:hypothetical protein ALC60_08340 [Trachymyrmex zeteki]|uniref:Uncharacterized protein n=1 Tax=Mycetomoellerius zeteki TaxID=64791 RepID=A0A151WX79_9HYME|nr:hypothetical protein ALC60_08340 [Trachymyrmex zeteki]